jgi:DNA modification methylase
MAGTDQEMLDQLISSISVDDEGLNNLLASLASPDPSSMSSVANEDEVPDIPSTTEPIVRLGELWLLGNHRLICGDSTDPKVLKKLFLTGDKAVLCVTSPPYWVGREYEQEHGREEIIAHIAKAAAAIDSVMADQGHISLNTGTTAETRQGGEVRRLWLLIDWWQTEFLKCKWNLRNMRIWSKEGGFAGFAPAQDLVGQNWEFIGEFTRDKPRGQNRLPDAPEWALAGVWDCQPQTASVGHTAPFPVEIPRREILLYTHEDEIVYEPYCGSGTTIIAAEQLDRRAYACEIEAGYAQLTIERWMRDTGKEAVRSDGVKWSTLLAKADKVAA